MDHILLACKALSDRNRLRILSALYGDQELCSCQLIELLGVSGATISRHLNGLQTGGFIDCRKEGRWIFFRLSAKLERGGELYDIGSWLKREFVNSEFLQEDRKRLDEIVTLDKTELCRLQRGTTCCPKK